MGCVVLLFALISPRVAIVATWLLTHVLGRAYDGWVLPLLGFFLLPWTTLAYAFMWNTGTHEVRGFEWFVVIVAFLADIGVLGDAARRR